MMVAYLLFCSFLIVSAHGLRLLNNNIERTVKKGPYANLTVMMGREPQWRNGTHGTANNNYTWPEFFPIGNSMLVYWNARANAACQQEPFNAADPHHPLLGKFPLHVDSPMLTPDMREKCAVLKSIEASKKGRVCRTCGYPHTSQYAPWRLFYDVIHKETQMVLKKFKAHPWALDPHTVAIHIRCDDYILLFHDEYGLLRHRYYENHIPNDTQRVVILSTSETFGNHTNTAGCFIEPPTTKMHKCTRSVFDLKAYLENHHPNITVELGLCGSDGEVGDWLFLASAYTVILSPSTFSFTAALGNPHAVIFPTVKPSLIVANGPLLANWSTFTHFDSNKTELLGGKTIRAKQWSDIREWLMQ